MKPICAITDGVPDATDSAGAASSLADVAPNAPSSVVAAPPAQIPLAPATDASQTTPLAALSTPTEGTAA